MSRTERRRVGVGTGAARIQAERPVERFSYRSQNSLIQEHQLRGQLARIQQSITISARNAEKLDGDCNHFSRQCATQGPVWKGALTTKLVELEAEKRILASFKEQAVRLEEQIDKLANPKPFEQAARRQHQESLAVLARERLVTDTQLERALRDVKTLLMERRELSLKMRNIAPFIDLSIGNDGFDTARFDELLNSLPSLLVAKSETWVDWFLGNPRVTSAHYVTDETLTLPETLASANYWHRGETAELTEEQAAEAFPERNPPPSMELDAAEADELRAWEMAQSR